AWPAPAGAAAIVWLVALTSIHWRESWKYGERAFRYCQHDLGHAVAALRLAASLAGWRTVMLPEWSQREIAALTGIDRDEDYVDAEREEPGCVLAVTSGGVPACLRTGRAELLVSVRAGHWTGRASQLSVDHVQWTLIDDIARVTEDPGRAAPDRMLFQAETAHATDARALIIQRRSAVAFDGCSSIAA